MVSTTKCLKKKRQVLKRSAIIGLFTINKAGGLYKGMEHFFLHLMYPESDSPPTVMFDFYSPILLPPKRKKNSSIVLYEKRKLKKSIGLIYIAYVDQLKDNKINVVCLSLHSHRLLLSKFPENYFKIYRGLKSF